MGVRLLDGRVALVTGGSRGIGAAAAVALAREGAHPVLVARTTGGLEATDDAIQAAVPGADPATLVPMDLCDCEKVDQLGPALLDRFGRLDILVCNAGMLGDLRPLSHFEPRHWDSVLATNLTANWRLIRVLEPLLKLSDAGRAIFVTGAAAPEPKPFWGPYAVSKAGLAMLAGVWAEELRNTPIRINHIDPGPVATRLRAQAYPGEDPDTLARADAVGPLFVELAGAECLRHGETLGPL